MSGPREKVVGLRPAAAPAGLRRFAASPGGGSEDPRTQRDATTDGESPYSTTKAFALVFLLTAAVVSAQQVPTPSLDGAEPAVRQRIASLQADLRADPGNGDAWGRYGMVLEAHTFTDEAIAAYRRAHELAPTTFRWPYLLAALVDERSAADSLPLYRAALALDPDYAPGHVRLAEALERTGQFDAANRGYAQAARLDAANAHAHAGLGRLALAASDTDAAVRHLSRARELAPENRSFAVTLAQAYARAGDRQRGQQLAAAARSLGRINYRNDPIRSSVQDLALDARSHLRRANAHRVHGELDLARRELRAGIEVDGERPELHFALAEVLAASGDPAGSLAAARRAHDLHPELEGVAPFLARALFQTGDFGPALAMAEEALERNAGDVSMMLLVALISAERGDVVRTVEILDRAYQARPQDSATRDGLIQLLTNVGEAMVSSGLPDAAAGQFEKALDLADEAGSPEAAGLRRRLAQVRIEVPR